MGRLGCTLEPSGTLLKMVIKKKIKIKIKIIKIKMVILRPHLNQNPWYRLRAPEFFLPLEGIALYSKFGNPWTNTNKITPYPKTL